MVGKVCVMLLAVALVALVAPGATAEEDCLYNENNTVVCYEETQNGDVDCSDQSGEFEDSYTQVHARNEDTGLVVNVIGASYCYDTGEYGSDADVFSATVLTPYGWGYVFWSQDSFYNQFGGLTFCTIAVYEEFVFGEYHFVDCPVGLGPPNPGWGDVFRDDLPG